MPCGTGFVDCGVVPCGCEFVDCGVGVLVAAATAPPPPGCKATGDGRRGWGHWAHGGVGEYIDGREDVVVVGCGTLGPWKTLAIGPAEAECLDDVDAALS